MRSRPALAGLLLVLGVVAVQLVRTDVYLRYVKPGLELPLVLTGCALVALGTAGVLADPDRSQARVPAAGWLLAVPVALVVLASPPALGSYGLAGRATPVPVSAYSLGELPPLRDGALDLTLREYARRLRYDAASLQGTPVRLVGFAVPATTAETARHGGGFFLTRIALSCCAADGQPVRVFVRGQHQPSDTWWTVEGRAPGSAGGSDAVLDADRETAIAAPSNPYTS